MIVSFGELLVDMIKEGDGYAPRPGGAPANFAVAASRLGHPTRLISSVGRDPFGDFLINHIKSEGIDTSFVRRSEKRTTLAFVELKSGNPHFFFYRGADADISPSQISPGMLDRAAHLHCGGFSLASEPIRGALFALLKLAKEKGTKVSFSPNTRPDVWNKEFDKYLSQALDFVDILITTKTELEGLSLLPEELMKKHGIEKLILTRGRGGSALYTSTGKTNMPIFGVETADTTGSGDAFAAGFICSLAGGMPDKDALRFATAVAALSVTKKGAMSALPTKDEVENFLKKQS